jgi:hypothetical protein
MVSRIDGEYVLNEGGYSIGTMTPQDRLWAAAVAAGVRTGSIEATTEWIVREAEKRGPATVACLGELLERVALSAGTTG